MWLDITFSAGDFEWSHVKNGVRMQKLWLVKVCCKKQTKTVQFGLNSDWTSGNRGQPDLVAELTFFGKKIGFFYEMIQREMKS
jgi:hypothetical protein